MNIHIGKGNYKNKKKIIVILTLLTGTAVVIICNKVTSIGFQIVSSSWTILIIGEQNSKCLGFSNNVLRRLLWLPLLYLKLFLNKVRMAPFSIASLFIVFQESIRSMNRGENPFKFLDCAKINGFLRSIV